MKKLSKFMFVVALGVALVASSANAAYTHTVTLKMGMRSAQVMELQKALNVTPQTGYFGSITNAAVKAFQASNGLVADGVVGPMTGAKIAMGGTSSTGGSTTGGSTTGSTTTLSGGAGDLDVTLTTTDVESDVEEGATEKVLGMELEATDSDIAVTNLKVTLEGQSGSYSKRLNKYIDSVSVWLGDKKVGEVDASDFTKDGDVYSKSISLSGVVVKEDDQENLYVGVTAISSVDDDAQTFKVLVPTMRFTDATGAILTADLPADIDTTGETFGFDAQGINDDLAIKSSSANPDAMTLRVNEDTKSDDMLVLAFKLDVDEDSSDIQVNEMPIHVSISTGTFATMINEVFVKIGSEEFTADRDAAGSATSGTYTVDFNDDFTIDSGDTEEVKVYVVFNKQDGNYSTGATITATVDGEAIDAEGSDDLTTDNLSGSASGKTHTLEVDAPMFELVSKSFALSQAIDGVTTGTEDIFLAKFTFDVTADEEDVYLPFDTTSGSGSVQYTITGGATVDSVVLDSDDSSIEEDNAFKVDAGATEKFVLSFYVRGNNASNKIEITGFGTATSDASTRSTLVTSGISDFKTSSVYLAK